MKKIMRLLFLSCLKATELVEKKFHIRLSFRENMQLKIHLMMCEACSKYEKQSSLIEKGIQNIKLNKDMKIDLRELKNRINSGLHQ